MVVASLEGATSGGVAREHVIIAVHVGETRVRRNHRVVYCCLAIRKY